ncbi:MAG: flagellar FlbD family protein [Phycisphaerales bacterium]|nr:flagellar FlbD family protein [Phycisphaerales bacterium]
MIVLTRLNGTPFVVNSEMIRTVEERPDTTITLVNGDTLIVREKMAEVVQKAVEYARMVRIVQLG